MKNQDNHPLFLDALEWFDKCNEAAVAGKNDFLKWAKILAWAFVLNSFLQSLLGWEGVIPETYLWIPTVFVTLGSGAVLTVKKLPHAGSQWLITRHAANLLRNLLRRWRLGWYNHAPAEFQRILDKVLEMLDEEMLPQVVRDLLNELPRLYVFDMGDDGRRRLPKWLYMIVNVGPKIPYHIKDAKDWAKELGRVGVVEAMVLFIPSLLTGLDMGMEFFFNINLNFIHWGPFFTNVAQAYAGYIAARHLGALVKHYLTCSRRLQRQMRDWKVLVPQARTNIRNLLTSLGSVEAFAEESLRVLGLFEKAWSLIDQVQPAVKAAGAAKNTEKAAEMKEALFTLIYDNAIPAEDAASEALEVLLQAAAELIAQSQDFQELIAQVRTDEQTADNIVRNCEDAWEDENVGWALIHRMVYANHEVKLDADLEAELENLEQAAKAA